MSTHSDYPYGVCDMSYEDCTAPATADGYCNDHQHYFSNGTSWDIWASEWCYRCKRDAFEQANPGSGRGCPLIMDSLQHKRIPEWMYVEAQGTDLNGQPMTYDKLICINFKPYGGGGGGEPKPKPVPPGQGQLFDPPSGTRMLSPLESEKEKVLVAG